ncbi:hypothetical protein [Oceanobacillus polygoni]|uniref:Uncharacterized protein n=1 Tax=Oceanobacillus polygoni TaxID=1235259 RepID=A0A9X0Z204_9BACI|nr:hypothetical protein [Oceanobacillus polygoni]MBP2080030.1 hypothetical protein [Oceanobacillus polygoni]
MSMISMLLPLVIFVFIIVAIAVAAGRLSKLFTAKRGYWMLFGYFLLLIISVGVYYFSSVSEEENVESKYNDMNRGDLYNVLYEGAPIESYQQYLEKEWEFPYEEDTLHIDYLGDDMNTINVAVERYDGNSIEAAFYQTPTYVNGENVQEYMTPIDLQLYSDQLVIELAELRELRFSSFAKEFPMQQFREGNDDWWWSGYGIEWGTQLLYLRIPNGIETSSNYDINIEYLNVSE